MSEKHTEGPLRLNYLENGAIAVECDSQTRRVATFHHQGNPRGDAKLFIAAPELLEELKHAVRRLKELGQVTDLADAIIAKAEGK